MPRGVSGNGMRMTAKRRALFAQGMTADQVLAATTYGAAASVPAFIPQVIEVPETDAEIDLRIRERFEILTEQTQDAITGDIRAMIVSGPAGLGKSFTVEKMLEEHDPEGRTSIIQKGFARATGLYKLLYQFRHPGCVIVFDDCDSIFFEDDALNLLKGACDTTETRRIGWAAETKMEDENGDPIPTRFTFEGSVIFITNYDMHEAIARGHRLAPHFEALISRSFYIDLAMKSRRDYVVRIRQVAALGLFADMKLTKAQENMAMNYIEKNRDELWEVSIRMAVKIGTLIRRKPNWEKHARITLMKQKGR